MTSIQRSKLRSACRRNHGASNVACLLFVAAVSTVCVLRMLGCSGQPFVCWMRDEQPLRPASRLRPCSGRTVATRSCLRRAVRPGIEVRGKVTKLHESGSSMEVDIGEDRAVIVPDGTEGTKVGDEVAVWVADMPPTGKKYVGTTRRAAAVTPKVRQKIEVATRKAEMLQGIVEHIEHPFADIMVTLEDGTAALGQLHVQHLGKGHVQDITAHLSVGQEVRTRVLGASPDTGRILLSMRPPLVAGEQVEGKVVRKLASGVVISIGYGKESVFLPQSEAIDFESLEVGSAVAPMWIMNVAGGAGRRPVGTMKDGRALSSRMQKKCLAAMESGKFLDGVVEAVKHPFATIRVTLEDGMTAEGDLHVKHLGLRTVEDIAEHLSVGEQVRARVFEVSEETGRLALSLCPLLHTGQQINGTVMRRGDAGAFMNIGDGQEDVFLPWTEVVGTKTLEEGTVIAPMWIMSEAAAPSELAVGTMRRVLTMEALERHVAAQSSSDFLDGVVDVLRHPFADIMVTLPDGTRVVGDLHIGNLGKGKVQDIADHLSVGEKLRVRICQSSIEKGRLSLSLCPLYKVGQQLQGRVVKLTPSSAVVSIGDGKDNVLLPHRDVEESEQLQVGSVVPDMWIACPGDGTSRHRPIGTPRKSRVMTPERQEALAAGMESEVLNGVVVSIQHPFALLRVVLADGTEYLGDLHAGYLGLGQVDHISHHLAVGEELPVYVRGVSRSTGFLLFSLRRPHLGDELVHPLPKHDSPAAQERMEADIHAALEDLEQQLLS